MKKLENIPKKNIFEVPEGYFDRLPDRVQARIASNGTAKSKFLPQGIILRYALAALLILSVGIFWFNHDSLSPAEKIRIELASINARQLADYLDEHEVGTDELVEKIAWSPADLDALEDSVYSGIEVSHRELDKLLNEYDGEL